MRIFSTFTILFVTACGSGTYNGPSNQTPIDGTKLPIESSCLSSPSVACADSSDCPMGYRCNAVHAPGTCERIYCGAEGTSCDEPELCAPGLSCYLNGCWASLPQGMPCGDHDAPPCKMGLE